MGRIKMKKNPKLQWFLFLVALTVIFTPTPLDAVISTTKHNLSTSGPGPIKADTEERVCVFCHTPHAAISDVSGISVPLWNHTLSTASYQLFDSVTFLSPTSPEIQPDGSARLCLSCHDGTIAIGAVVNSGGASTTISMNDSGTGALTGGKLDPVNSSGYLGTVLTGHHPISIEMNSTLVSDKGLQCDNNLVSFRVCNPLPASVVKRRKTKNTYPPGGSLVVQGVQCTSCHDPHNDPDPGTSVFLVTGDKNNYDALCIECHVDCSSSCP